MRQTLDRLGCWAVEAFLIGVIGFIIGFVFVLIILALI